MPTGMSRSLAVLGWVLGAAVASVAHAQDSPASAYRAAEKIARVQVRGDLETMVAASELAERLEQAAERGATLVVLELNGQRGRLDVVHAMAESVKRSKVPVAAWLPGARGKAIGVAQLCVGMSGTRCVVRAGQSVRAGPAADLRAVAPDKTDWEREARELSGSLYARLREAGGPGDLSQVLVGALDGAAAKEAWVVVSADAGAEPRIAFEDPRRPVGAEVWRLVAPGPKGALELGVSVERLLTLHAVTDVIGPATTELAALGVRGAQLPAAIVDADIAPWRSGVEAGLRVADEALRRAEDKLDLPKPPKADISPDTYRRAASSARAMLKDADRGLSGAEANIEKCPELTRTPAPGQSAVAGKPSSYGTRWKSLFQQRRDRIAKLEAKAATFESGGK